MWNIFYTKVKFNDIIISLRENIMDKAIPMPDLTWEFYTLPYDISR